jgi:membrane-bound lytic murein transglycosylase B
MKFSALPVLLSLALAGYSAEVSAAGQRSANHRVHAADPAELGEFVDFTQWREAAAFIDDMVDKHGFERSEVLAMLKKARYVDLAVQLVKPPPPGKPKNWAAYRSRFIEPVRIRAGMAFWNSYEGVLAKAEQQYGVPAEIIVGILGVETIYGRQTGKFRVMDAIATLAFAYPDTPNRAARMDYFRSELENTMLFARDEGIDPYTLLGSYAGAIGLPQFMPGSILQYGVDFDGDDRIDLRNSPVDAIGSVANFLAEHGWRRGEPIAFPVRVNAPATGETAPWQQFIGQSLEAKYSLAELKTGGVQPAGEVPADMHYGLVDLQNGFEPTEYWLGTANFFAISQYNRSFFYAMSVVDLGRAVREARVAAGLAKQVSAAPQLPPTP